MSSEVKRLKISASSADQVRTWSFGEAPLEFQALFPEGSDQDWVTHVPASVRHVFEPFLMGRQRTYTLKSKELPGRNVVYYCNRFQGDERMHADAGWLNSSIAFIIASGKVIGNNSRHLSGRDSPDSAFESSDITVEEAEAIRVALEQYNAYLRSQTKGRGKTRRANSQKPLMCSCRQGPPATSRRY